ncbi:hypothetical protein WJX73_001446 [Symbiochloris irregularis]|uniref:Uncharacterized protein n=1 Tax=Symbiochloris irregularis TaxID=706552 RepID=A0AAW1PGB8_9CHLO
MLCRGVSLSRHPSGSGNATAGGRTRSRKRGDTVALSRGSIERPASSSFCSTLVGSGDRTVLLAADPGAFIGTGEAEFILQNLKDARNLTGSGYCAAVLVVTSGIAAPNQIQCMNELLQCSSQIKEVIAFGTSGWSAKLGGVIDPLDCSQPVPGNTPTRIGDICVTPFASNWNCKQASWTEQCTGFPNVCSYPMADYDLDAPFLFGDCVFTNHTGGDMALTMEVTEAAEMANYPERSTGIANYTSFYWGQTQNQGTNELYDVDNSARPVVYNYTQCAITSSQFFWSGVPWDAVARNYTAQTINAATGLSLTQRDVIAIPYTIVRSNSDYVHVPVKRLSGDSWADATPFLAPDFLLGYPYAIISTSFAIIQTMANRCTAANGDSSSLCAFTIPYNTASS